MTRRVTELSPEQVREAVERFDATPAHGVYQLNQAAFLGRDQAEALRPFLEDPEPRRRWAAAYVLGLVLDDAGEAEALAATLDDESPGVRVTAAGALIGLGVVESVAVLVEATDSDAAMAYSDPPRATSAFARAALEAYTGETFETAKGWRDWLQMAGERLSWDGEQYVVG